MTFSSNLTRFAEKDEEISKPSKLWLDVVDDEATGDNDCMLAEDVGVVLPSNTGGALFSSTSNTWILECCQKYE